MSQNRLAVICFLTGALALGGCGKKPPPPAPTAPETPQPVAETPPPPPPPPPGGAPAPAAAEPMTPQENATFSKAQSTAGGYTLMVQQFYDQKGRMPTDFSELVAAKMLLKVPQAPPGYRFVIDPASKSVKLVRQ